MIRRKRAISADLRKIGALEYEPLRRGRLRLTCWGPSGRVGRRVTLTGPQLMELGEGLRQIRSLDDGLALVGIWREASRHRDPATFVGAVVAELRALPPGPGEPVFFKWAPT